MRFLFIITYLLCSFPLSGQEPAFYKKQEVYQGTGNAPGSEIEFITILMKSIAVKAGDDRTEFRSRYVISFIVDTNGYIREMKLLDDDTADDIGKQIVQQYTAMPPGEPFVLNGRKIPVYWRTCILIDWD